MKEGWKIIWNCDMIMLYFRLTQNCERSLETFSVLQALDSHFRRNDEVANLFCSLTLILPTDTVFWPWIPVFTGMTE